MEGQLDYREIKNIREHKRIGYLYFCDKTHPLVAGTSNTMVYLHRHIMSVKIGRWLKGCEIVHHLDGDKKNNRPSNLIITTGAEHTRIHKGRKKEKKCIICDKSFYISNNVVGKYCSLVCKGLGSRRVERPSLDVLKKELKETNYVAVGKKYGVSDNAIRKWVKYYNKNNAGVA